MTNLLQSKKLESILTIVFTQQPQIRKVCKEAESQLKSQVKFCTQYGNKMQFGHKCCGGCGHKGDIEQ